MPLLRLLSAAFIVSALALQAAGQSAPPAPYTGRIITVFPQSQSQTNPLIPLGKRFWATDQVFKAATLTAQLNSACATLRMYGFTDHDLKSYNPHASNYTTCSRVAANDLKEIVVQPAIAKAVKSAPPTP